MNLKERLKAIRMVVLDVDGVLTDGRVWITSSGEEALGFDVKDGMGVARLIGAGIEVALLSGRNSPAAAHRARALGISRARLGASEKTAALKEMAADAGCSLDGIAYVGDDLADLGPMKLVGLAVAVADAAPEIIEVAHLRLEKPGGKGAVRELAEKILRSQDKWW